MAMAMAMAMAIIQPIAAWAACNTIAGCPDPARTPTPDQSVFFISLTAETARTCLCHAPLTVRYMASDACRDRPGDAAVSA